jgi:[CysO sulfur-carrier protein]-S-L-cysteine hydrolase
MQMRLLLPPDIQEELSGYLVKGGTQEVGGVLMGQHIASNEFRVVQITCQIHSGSFAYFLRSVVDILAPLRRFFQSTNHNYTQFNYIGEWHSHPSFALKPSLTDCDIMQSLVEDSNVGATFAVLLLVKLNVLEELDAATILFRPQVPPAFVETVFE